MVKITFPHTLYQFASILKALIKKLPLALCDAGDFDGIASAALFKIKYPNGVIVLANPSEVRKKVILRAVTWTFVADLPCPGKVLIRADHHETNRPCALREYWDPGAPASAYLAIKAFNLEDNELAGQIARYAVETDTANLASEEAELLDSAVKGASYPGRIYLAERLASIGVNVLREERVARWIEKHRKSKVATERICNSIGIREETIVVFERDIGLSYRYLCILLEKAGAEFTFVVVRKGPFRVRVYAGAKPESKYDASKIASRLGGGGHSFAAGASITCLGRTTEFFRKKLLPVLREFLKKEEIVVYIVGRDGSVREKIFK